MPTILLNNIRPKGSLLKNLKVGSTEVKYVKRGDGKFFYDTLNDTTYSAITISKFSYSTATVAASGGSTSTPSYSYSQTATPVGHAGSYSSSTITSGASISFSKVSGDGATVNPTTGVVTFDSRGTTYSASLRSAVVRITVSLNGKSATKDCTVYQNKNVITSMIYSASSGGALTNPATYAAGGATKSVANKTSASATVQLTFSSTSKTTSYGSYGTLTTTYSWSSNQPYATLSSSNASSKDVTMASRGTDYSNSNRTATITRSVAFSYSLSSDYNNANLSAITANKSTTATVTLEANPFTTIIIAVSGGSLTNPANYVAKGGTKNVANATAASVSSVKLTFKSGSSVTDYSKYGSLSGPTYSWKSSKSYATLTSANSASLDVTMANRATTYGASTRSATITRTATFTYTLNSDYTVTTNNPGTATATATVTLNKNIFQYADVYVKAGALTNPDTYAAGGGTKTVSNNTAASLVSVTLTFDSESTTTSYSTYGSVSGPVYSWSSNQSYATLSSSNAASLDVTMASRGTTYANSTRKATITRKATYTFSLSSSYTGFSTATGYANTTATVTQAKNIITSFGKPSISAGALTNPSTYTAAAQTLLVANKTAASASVTLTFSSGSTKVTSDSTYGSFTGPTYSWSSNQSYATLTSSNAASLNVKMTSRGTTYSTSTRSATITRTASFSYALSSNYNAASLSSTSNSASTTATVTLAKNVIIKTEFTSPSGGALTNPATYAAGGATKSVANKTAASTGVKLTFSSTSTSTSYDSYGTLTGPTYSWSSNQSYATLTSANSSSLNVTMANRTTTYGGSRTATITRTASFSYSLDSDYNNASLTAITTSKTATATVTQSSNNFTAVTIKIGAGTLTNPATYAASGGTKNVASASAASLTSITLTFASGSTTTDYNTYGSVSGPVYSWTSNQGYATLSSANLASLNVTMADRATTHGALRTAKITRKATYTYTFSSTYGGSSTPNSANATATVTQAANSLSVKSVTVSGGALTAPGTYGAGGATKSVANKTAATATGVLLFASGDEVAASSTYGSWSGPTYSWTSSQTYATLSSSNAASKDVAMSNRTTTIGNSRTAAITRTASFTFTLSSTYGSGSKSNTGSCKATITQAANLVTGVTSVINSFSYGSKAVAKGGTVNATSDRSCTLTFTSGSTKSGCTTTAGYTGGTITNTASWAGSATGATVATSTGNVTWANRTTTIGTERSVEVTMSAKYTFTHSSTYGGAAIEGNTATKKATCSQNANYVTAVSVNSNSLSYANIGAGATSASPTSSHKPIFTFSSTSTSTTTPGSSYGTLTTTIKYTLAASKNGFTAVNANSGVLTATARGTTIGNARTSDTVTKSLTYSWTHSSTYSGGGTKSSSANTKTATCTLNANLVTAVTTQVNYSIGDATAAGGTVTATKSGSCTLKFSSGSSIASQTLSGGYTGGTITVNSWSFSGSGTGATLDASTGNVAWANRTTNVGNKRSIKVTASRTYSFTHDSTYGGTTVTGSAGSASDTSYLAGNYVTKVTPAASSGYTTNVTYPNISAAGGTSTPALHGTTTYTYSSGSTGGKPDATYGSASVTRAYSGTLATGFTKIDATTGVVTASDRGTTEGAARSQTVTVKMTVTWTPTSSYNAAGTITGSVTHTPTCTQNANSKTLTSIKIVATLPDASWLATSSWSAVPAGGHYLGVYGYYCYTWSSGDPSETFAGNLKTGLTYTTSMAEVHTNGGLHILNRTTTIGKARSGTVYWTYNGLTSNTLSFTLVANLVTAVAVNSNSFSYTNAGAGATSQAATTSHAPKYTFTSGKTSTTTPSSTYGSLTTTATYSLEKSQNGFTAVNSSTGALTCTSRGTTIGNARASATVTKSVTYKWTPTSGYGSAVTSSASTKTATCTLVGNYVTEITAVSASNTSYGHTYYANTAAAGATTSPTTNGTATYKFTSGSTGTYSSSSVPSGVTWTWTRTYSVSGTATSGSSLNTSTGAVTWTNNTTTSARSTKVSVKLTASLTHSSTYSAGGTISKSSTITATSTLNAGSLTKHINAASLSFTAAGGTKTPTVTYTIKWNGIVTSTTNSLTSFSLTETADAGGKFSASGKSVTASKNTSTSSTYSATYTISASGYNNGTLTCSMSKDAVSSYAKPVISSFTVSDIPAKGGTISSGTVSYSLVVTYVSGNTKTLTSGGTVTYSAGVTGSNLTTTLTARTKKGTLTATVTMNGKSGTKTADVYQAINQVTSIAFTPDSSASTLHCYWSTTSFGAKGGSCAVILNGNVTATYSSGSTGKPSTGGSFSYSRTYSASGTGFTVDTAGKVTAANRTSNIGNKRTGTVSSALTITWTPTSIGSTKTCKANASTSLSQNGNYVTGLTCQSNAMSYANVGAGATSSAAPTTSWGNALFTYSSGTLAAGAPASTYGTYSSSKSFTIANKTTNGFTNINASTGVLTCTNRTTTIGNARASATVTCKLTMTWTPTSSYNAAGTITGTKSATATCTQNGNYVTKVVASASSGYSTHVTYPNITAAGGTSTPTLSGSATFTFSSGSTGSAPSTTYGTTTYTRTYSGTLATGFTAINSSTGVVTASGRGTTFGNARSLTVTAKLIVKFVHASSYSAGGTVSSAALSHSPKCTQNGNYVTAVTPKASTGYSTHASYASTISAAGGTVSPTNHGLATYTFSSGQTVTDGSTSWTTAGTTTYTRTYSATLATGFTSVTTAGAVTASGRGKTSGNARSQTVSAKLTVKFVHSSTYSAGGTKEGSVTHSITCTLNHNNPSTVYNTPTIASATSSDIPASGGTFAKSWLTVKYNQTAYYSYPSGSNTSSSPHSVASSATATQAMISFTGTAPKGSNLGTTTKSRTSKGSVTVTVTANSKTSSGKSVTVYQQANLGTTITTEIKPTLSYAGMSSKTGLTSTPTVGYTWKYYISYTSGKDTDVSTVNSPNGPGISAMSPKYTLSNTTYFSINSSTGVVTTKSANTSTTADRTATVTLKLTFGGKTGQTTATVIQSKKASYYNLSWQFSTFNVTNSIYSFGFKFTNSVGNLFTLGGGGGSGGTSNPSRVGTSSIRSDISTSVFRPYGFYFTNMNSTYSMAKNSSGCYLDGSTGKYYYVRWAYGKAPTTSNYKTHGYKFYSGIVESWTYSASTLYVWVYQA